VCKMRGRDLLAVIDSDDVCVQPPRAPLLALLTKLRPPQAWLSWPRTLTCTPTGRRVNVERLECAGLVTGGREPQPRDGGATAGRRARCLS
jgi:hypothetical protein